MSIAIAPLTPAQANATDPTTRNRLVGKHTQTPAEAFDEISRKLTAGPLTLEYLVAYSIEAYSKRTNRN